MRYWGLVLTPAQTDPPERCASGADKPRSERETVKEAAMQWGFWHLGQFATDYQQLFAEKPSMTLHHRLRQWV